MSELNPDWAKTQRFKIPFEARYNEIGHWVEKRRRGIDLAMMEWQDVKQQIIVRVYQQYAHFDPAKGEFKKWVNRVITHKICSIWRDNLAQFSRPCITGKGGCPFNCGGGTCSKTPSGLQCGECPIYRDWEKRKGSHHAIHLPLSLDNHASEVHNSQSDFTDIAAKKKLIDTRMKEKLTRMEWRIYRLLHIKGLSEEEVAKQIGFKKRRAAGARMYDGYAAILAAKHLFVKTAKLIIDEDDLAA